MAVTDNIDNKYPDPRPAGPHRAAALPSPAAEEKVTALRGWRLKTFP